jgi:ethanolamine transporter EutH
MGAAIATIQHIRGETIVFGLRSTPAYSGSETVTCDIKVAVDGANVPAGSAAVVLSITPVFDSAEWFFTITAAQSEAIGAGVYITDAKIIAASGSVDYPKPLLIDIDERVTG